MHVRVLRWQGLESSQIGRQYRIPFIRYRDNRTRQADKPTERQRDIKCENIVKISGCDFSQYRTSLLAREINISGKMPNLCYFYFFYVLTLYFSNVLLPHFYQSNIVGTYMKP